MERCYLHANRQGKASCQECSKTICPACERVWSGRCYCPRCILVVRRRRKRRWLGGSVLAVCVLVGAAFAGWELWQAAVAREAAQDALERARKLRSAQKARRRARLVALFGHRQVQELLRLREILRESPCNRRALANLLAIHTRSSTLRYGQRRLRAFLRRCPVDVRLLFHLLRFQMELSDYKAAHKTTTRILQIQPYNARAYAQRGLAFLRLGALSQASRNLRQALLLQPTLSKPPQFLAEAEERQGHACKAADALRHGLKHAYSLYVSQKPRIERLLRQGGCFVRHAYGGEIHVPFFRHSGLLVFSLRVHDRLRVRFVLDTGASISAISPQLAKHLWKKLPASKSSVLVRTAGGIVRMPLVQLQMLSHRHFHIRRLQVTILPQRIGAGAHGLLGQNFLSHFRSYRIDNQNHQLILVSY